MDISHRIREYGVDRLAEQIPGDGRDHISAQAIYKWLAKGRIPSERVLDVERATGIPRHHLRPDLYPAEQAV